MRKYCKYCGKLYDPDWNIFHGDEHLLLCIPRYDEETGEEIKRQQAVRRLNRR